MSGLALAIVVVAALFHASWNFLAKKSKKKMAFIWWFLFIATIAYLPMFLYYWPRQTVSPAGWACIVATGILHALYFWFMGGAYERGDLSLVYPLSRGSGPLFVPVLADKTMLFPALIAPLQCGHKYVAFMILIFYFNF